MASLLKLFITMSFLALIVSSTTESRPNPEMSLAVRTKLNDEISDCWGSLYQLQACTAEIITFFLTGETYLGPNCCEAIKVIQHECWPTLLGSLGYTTEEGDILEAYCDTSAIDTLLTMSPPQLAMAPSMDQNSEPKSFAP
ncbi:egg cell-secreted protein 1.1-like [Cucurbita maxima]|uniref:Egg cell-secreted protein 1.1-like n=1 Tax=Cucurbita maxima TaxID=3661 RepID=A0A6J1KD37_CUCMA|nr:egg cell-secreted protein 1.1-like [Cucurbita maxima]